MNERENEIYQVILKMMEEHKKVNPTLYNNNNYEFVRKEEFNISNNAYKGVILFKINNNYLLDIYVGNGIDSVITGLLSKIVDNLENATSIFNDKIEYVKNNDVIEILTSGKNNYEL